MNLSHFNHQHHKPGRTLPIRLLWYITEAILFNSAFFPFSSLKSMILIAFGARIGTHFVIKPYVKLKYPWKFSCGNNVWVGEGVWIDNIESVDIGAHVCISQGSYLCTGNHDWTDVRFRLSAKSIQIENHAWIGARALVGPGLKVGIGAVITAGSVLTCHAKQWTIYSGNPAKAMKRRILKTV